MKKIIMYLLFAVLAVPTMSAQEETKTIYIIDGKHIDNFDGSQLKGKTIESYSIDTKHDINVHVITTKGNKPVKDVKVLSSSRVILADSITQPYAEAYTKALKVDNTNVQHLSAGDAIYVLNGKVVSLSEITKIATSSIISMEVIKDTNNPDYIKYTKDAKREPKCVIKIITKSNHSYLLPKRDSYHSFYILYMS